MATHEEPLPAWLEAELKAQGVRPPPPQPRPQRAPERPSYGRGEECPY
jgi:hypothetical protein